MAQGRSVRGRVPAVGARIAVHRVTTPCIGVWNKPVVTSTVSVQTTTPKLLHTRTRLYDVMVFCR
jgi:hypothetical protein